MSNQRKYTCAELGVCHCPTDVCDCDTAQAFAVLARFREMEGHNLPIPDPNTNPMGLESLVQEIRAWLLIAVLSVILVISICGVAGYAWGVMATTHVALQPKAHQSTAPTTNHPESHHESV